MATTSQSFCENSTVVLPARPRNRLWLTAATVKVTTTAEDAQTAGARLPAPGRDLGGFWLEREPVCSTLALWKCVVLGPLTGASFGVFSQCRFLGPVPDLADRL